MRCSTSLRAQTIAEGSCSITAAQTSATGAVAATEGGVAADRVKLLGAVDAAEPETCVLAGLFIERFCEPALGSGGGTTRGGGVGDGEGVGVGDCDEGCVCDSGAAAGDGVGDDDCGGNCGGAIARAGVAASGLLAVGVRAFFFRSCRWRAAWKGLPSSPPGQA
jgi:hypothetical protein